MTQRARLTSEGMDLKALCSANNSGGYHIIESIYSTLRKKDRRRSTSQNPTAVRPKRHEELDSFLVHPERISKHGRVSKGTELATTLYAAPECQKYGYHNNSKYR